MHGLGRMHEMWANVGLFVQQIKSDVEQYGSMIEKLAEEVKQFSTEKPEEVAEYVAKIDETLSQVRRKRLSQCSYVG